MSSQTFTAYSDISINDNFAPDNIIVRSRFSTPINPIKITIEPTTNEDRIFTVVAYTDAFIISTFEVLVPAGHSAVFTRIGLISLASVYSAPSRAIVSLVMQNPTTNVPITYSSAVDSASEISLEGNNAFRYFSRGNTTLLAQSYLATDTLSTGTNTLKLMCYPNIPGAEGNIDDASLIPVMSANSSTWNGLPFVMSASSEFSVTFAAYKVTFGGDWYTASSRTGWLQVKLPFRVNIYKVALRGVRSSYGEYFTKWAISGSNDGVNFTTLLSMDQRIPDVGTSYILPTRGIYQYIRFTGLDGVGVNLGLSMFQVFSPDYPVKLLEQAPSLAANGNNYGNIFVYTIPKSSLLYFWLLPTWAAGTNLAGYIMINK